MSSKNIPHAASGDHRFQTTHWSLVIAAGDRGQAGSQAALEQLCRDYWYPVYAFIRRRVANPHEAQDMTQAFFSRLLEKNYLADARRERGRFRTFLLTATQRFVMKEWTKARAQKRGGGRTLLSLDFATGETQFAIEPADESTPEREFDRRWALQLLQLVDQQLRDENARSGKAEQFDQLKPFVAGEPTESYEQLAERLATSAGAARTAVYRLRQRFRELIRAEIAKTVATEVDIDDEVRRLFEALA